MPEIKIRLATENDAEKLLKIYAPYVENTAISFEYEVPSLEEFKDRIKNISKRYPYLVAYKADEAIIENKVGNILDTSCDNIHSDDEILGYAYCGQFKSRSAYDMAVETTVYIREDAKRQGIGKLLYDKLEELLKLQNVTNLNACIASVDIEDEHLTNDSSRFHERMGYNLVGEFHKCGYKFDRWYNMVWMEKMILPHETPARQFIPFSELDIRL